MTLKYYPDFGQLLVLYLVLTTSISFAASAAETDVDNSHEKYRRSVEEEFQDYPAAVAGFLLAQSTDKKLNLEDPIDQKLSQILDRHGPDLRTSREAYEYTDIPVNISIRAWELMHEHASAAIRQKIDASWPVFKGLMSEAKTSRQCVKSVERMLEGAKRMESWAVVMLNSWGGFPMNGLFDGTYGDVGSFDSCVGVSGNKYIDHAHYCSLSYRPVLPSIKNYSLIIRREPEALRNHFESEAYRAKKFNLLNSGDNSGDRLRDVFTDLLEHAQYHHTVYYKWGTCWPIQCSPYDVKGLAKIVGRKSILLSGPVKCYSKNGSDYENLDQADQDEGGNKSAKKKLFVTTMDTLDGIFIWKPELHRMQKIAFAVIVFVTGIIILFTLIDVCINRVPQMYEALILCLKGMPLDSSDKSRHLSPKAITSSFATCGEAIDSQHQQQQLSASCQVNHPTKLGFSMVPNEPAADQVEPTDWMTAEEREPSLVMKLADDLSIVSNTRRFFQTTQNQMRQEILCLNGLRCLTMVWVIVTHTMLFNDWTQFARTRTIEESLQSPFSQPIFNGTYLVDIFFVVSGLLSSYTSFRQCEGIRAKFSSLGYIVNRWMRLTPQIIFLSMIYIVLPTVSHGPYWNTILGEFSDNCRANWWINAFHLQAFYKKKEMCNFVTWWISIDFFYHFFGLAVIWATISAGHRYGFLSIAATVLSSVVYQSYKHYTEGMPPGVFSTVPQTGAMWSTMTLEFFWTPYTHSMPYFFGFYIGYLMALKKKIILKQLNTCRALLGWTSTIVLLCVQSFSTYWWVTDKAQYSQPVSTIFFGVGSFIWSASICWIIIACQHGYGGFLNRALSCKVFVVLGRASYLVFLSHFHILFIFYGTQSVFLEPSGINMLYIILGNLVLSTVYGSFLCIVYEIPWLKVHQRFIKCA